MRIRTELQFLSYLWQARMWAGVALLRLAKRDGPAASWRVLRDLPEPDQKGEA